jgi:hypothetical protein
MLVHTATIGGEVERIGFGVPQGRFPIDNTVIGLQAGTLSA